MTEGTYLMDRIRSRCVEEGDCLLWTGATTSNGTPTMRMPITRQMTGVRRAMLEASGAVIKDGAVVTSKCGNAACVAVEHAWPVTRSKLSSLSAERTGYHLRPTRNAKIAKAARAKYGKLTEEARDDIRALEGTMSQRAIAEKHGVGQHAISDVLRGNTWRDYSNPFAGLGAR